MHTKESQIYDRNIKGRSAKSKFKIQTLYVLQFYLSMYDEYIIINKGKICNPNVRILMLAALALVLISSSQNVMRLSTSAEYSIALSNFILR